MSTLPQDDKNSKSSVWAPPTLAQWMEEVEDEIMWLITGFIPHSGKVLISGQKKRACKTLFALTLGVTMATGRVMTDLLYPNKDIVGRPIVIVLEEGTKGETRDRIAKLCAGFGVNEQEIDNIIFIFHERVKLDTTKWKTRLLGLVTEVQPSLVILDPFYKLHGGDENKASDVMPVIDVIEDIRNLGASVCLVAHLDKTRGENPNVDMDSQVRGTGILTDDYDLHIALRRYKMEDPTIKCIVRSKGGAEKTYQVGWEFSDEKTLGSVVEEGGIECAYKIHLSKLERGRQYTKKELKAIWECPVSKMNRFKDMALEKGDFKTTGNNIWLYTSGGKR